MLKNKSKFKIIVSLFLVAGIMTFFGLTAFADDDISFTYDETTKTLTVTGSGSMTDYTQDNFSSVAWSQYKNQISKVVISEGITHLGAYSFCRETMLSEISLPSTLVSIGENALSGLDNLDEITVPDTVTEIGSNAFGLGYDMTLNPDFTVNCSAGSAAQEYCIKNYIYANSPFSSSKSESAVITSSNYQAIWSFEPKTDGTLTFSSSGNSDTEGLIYNADNYVYSDTYSVMKNSAVAYSDDDGDNLNFLISYDVKAGERYYLSAKFRSSNKTSGSFDVSLSFACKTHIFTEEVLTAPTCILDGEAQYTCDACGYSYTSVLYSTGHSYGVSGFSDGIATLSCSQCGDSYNIAFKDYINKDYPPLDAVNDGIINAKDYAQLSKMYN